MLVETGYQELISKWFTVTLVRNRYKVSRVTRVYVAIFGKTEHQEVIMRYYLQVSSWIFCACIKMTDLFTSSHWNFCNSTWRVLWTQAKSSLAVRVNKNKAMLRHHCFCESLYTASLCCSICSFLSVMVFTIIRTFERRVLLWIIITESDFWNSVIFLLWL